MVGKTLIFFREGGFGVLLRRKFLGNDFFNPTLIKNALTRSIFKLEKCFYFLNGSEFCQELISTIIRVLVRHLCAKSSIKL